MRECWRCNQDVGTFKDPGVPDSYLCGYCFRDAYRRCPTCGKPNTDLSCRAYT